MAETKFRGETVTLAGSLVQRDNVFRISQMGIPTYRSGIYLNSGGSTSS